MIIQAELKCKQTGCEADPCAVDKVIELPSPRFQQFSRALLADYDFIAENKNAIRHDEDARHCLLILDAEGMDGFLVDPQGHNYARYISENAVSCVRIASCCVGVFVCHCFWSRWPEAPRCRGPPVLHFNPHSPTTF